MAEKNETYDHNSKILNKKGNVEDNRKNESFEDFEEENEKLYVLDSDDDTDVEDEVVIENGYKLKEVITNQSKSQANQINNNRFNNYNEKSNVEIQSKQKVQASKPQKIADMLEKDETFCEMMKIYSNERKSNYVKNDIDLRDIFKDEVECNECDYIGEGDLQLQKHKDSKHGDTLHEFMWCVKCGFTTTQQNILDKHILDEHPVIDDKKKSIDISKQQLYSCNLCDFSVNREKHLKVHMENDHKHSCNQCDYTAVNKNELTNHIKRSHSNLKNHNTSRTKFCHFWNNKGFCRNEKTCTFLHEESPYCVSQNRCQKYRCEYFHEDFSRMNPIKRI